MPAGRPAVSRQLPQCRIEGLNCHECVRSNARLVANLAADLDTSSMRQLFLSIYPERACTPMATTFVQILIEESPVRRAQPRAARPAALYHTAVA